MSTVLPSDLNGNSKQHDRISRMWIRKRFDISARDLHWAARRCLFPAPTASANARAAVAEEGIGACWGSGDLLVTLSVRSAWDLLLSAVGWDPGDEVIVSGLTIPDMPRIIREHGLVPVAVDIDPKSLAPDAQAVEARITSRTKAILVAHLFGGLCDLDDLAALVSKHELMLIEDCAQAWSGGQRTSDPRADVSLFSFGPIKTNTALGGGVIEVRHVALLDEMRRLHALWPRQSRWEFLRRVLKYRVLSAAASPLSLAAIVRLAALVGRSHDALISRSACSFPGPRFFEKIRRRPAVPLTELMQRKLLTFDPSRIELRQQQGKQLARRLNKRFPVPGITAQRQTWWVVAVLVDCPEQLIQTLWKAGFDATQASSLQPVCEQDLPLVVRMLRHLVFLPFDPQMPANEQQRMVNAIDQANLAAPDWAASLQHPQIADLKIPTSVAVLPPHELITASSHQTCAQTAAASTIDTG
jgi:perosamine synthetase